MSLVLRGAVPLLVLMLGIAPAEAGPEGCTGFDPSVHVQDDAGSGGDAAALREIALRLPDGSFTGTLVAGADGMPVDGSDWYGFSVGDAAERVMVELDAYTIAPGLVSLFVVDVTPPNAAEPAATVPLGDGRVAFDGAPGLWTLNVRFATGTGGACGGIDGPSVTPLASFTHNYVLYFGCDPVCL